MSDRTRDPCEVKFTRVYHWRKKNYLMCYLLRYETNPVSKKTLSGIKYNRQKLRKTCVLSDTLISMVSYEKHNLHN